MSDLLGLAEAQLAAARPHSNRMACWLARSALEQAVDDLLASQDVTTGPHASVRSKLTCLEVAYESTDVPAQAQYAWSRLSEACHQHAYQLTPTSSEVKHLIELVRSLREQTTIGQPA